MARVNRPDIREFQTRGKRQKQSAKERSRIAKRVSVNFPDECRASGNGSSQSLEVRSVNRFASKQNGDRRELRALASS